MLLASAGVFSYMFCVIYCRHRFWPSWYNVLYNCSCSWGWYFCTVIKTLAWGVCSGPFVPSLHPVTCTAVLLRTPLSWVDLCIYAGWNVNVLGCDYLYQFHFSSQQSLDPCDFQTFQFGCLQICVTKVKGKFMYLKFKAPRLRNLLNQK